MRTTATKLRWQRGWVLGLALFSLVVPLAAVILRQEPVAPLTDPARVNYYRQTIVALVVGLACAIGAFVGMRKMPAAGIGWVSVALASLGVLVSAYLLWVLIGSCGVQVIWGACQP